MGEATGENTDGSVNFLPSMGMDTLVEGYRDLMGSLYSPTAYYRRIHTFLTRYRPTVKSRVTVSDIKALLHSMWRIGLFSQSRWLYWKLLARTAFTRIRSLPVSVEMAICGLHFEKCAGRMKKK
jgi:hypothetical protein